MSQEGCDMQWVLGSLVFCCGFPVAQCLKYVYKTTQLADIEKQYPTIQFDADYLKNLQEKIKTKEEKAANILFTLNRFIIIDKHRNPMYETLIQKVERTLKLWKEKTKDYEKIYNQARRS